MSKSFSAALAAAQGEMSGATKDSKNPHFKSSYASLASVVDAIRAPLAKHEIGWTQQVSSEGTTVSVVTILLHAGLESGEYRSGTMRATAKDASPQAIGSTVTYLRRYSLMATLGIPAEDDDGEQAQPRGEPRPESRPESRHKEPHPMDAEPEQVDAWLASLGKAPISSRDAAGLDALRRVLVAGGSQADAYRQWRSSK
jgi:hypothetical protein